MAGVQVIGQPPAPFRRRRRRVQSGQNAELATILALLDGEFNRRDQFDFLNLQSENTQKAIRLQAEINKESAGAQRTFLGKQSELQLAEQKRATDLANALQKGTLAEAISSRQASNTIQNTQLEQQGTQIGQQGDQIAALLETMTQQRQLAGQAENERIVGLEKNNPKALERALGISNLETPEQATARVGGELQGFQNQITQTRARGDAGRTSLSDALQTFESGKTLPSDFLTEAGNMSASLIRNMREGDPGVQNQSRADLSELRNALAGLRPQFEGSRSGVVNEFENLAARAMTGVTLGASSSFSERTQIDSGLGDLFNAELFQIDRALKSKGGLNLPPDPRQAGAEAGVTFQEAQQEFVEQSGVLQRVEQNPTTETIHSPLTPSPDGVSPVNGLPDFGGGTPGTPGAGLTPDNLGRLLARRQLMELGLIA